MASPIAEHFGGDFDAENECLLRCDVADDNIVCC